MTCRPYRLPPTAPCNLWESGTLVSAFQNWPASGRAGGLVFAATVVAIVLLVYSQTLALSWDEGYHLLAAQLVKAGKTPYIDFCFPQTPLNTYWNAGWMWILGERWRALHAVAALTSWGAVLLVAIFLWTRFPAPGWRGMAAFAGVALIGLNVLVVQFGTVGQPYALCLIL